ncbi:MAG: transcriptional regulator with PAS, ATPase and Fis domain [Bacteroidia bacterium]|jgi:transcriptional regulator with PAS, ATPase and Fis domain
MAASQDIELTRPSVVAPGRSSEGEDELLLTIAFHADTARIGEWAVVTQPKAPLPWILGRRSPDFRRTEGGPAVPLEDPHVSRQSLRFDYEQGKLRLTREPSSSRVRLGDIELTAPSVLEPDLLRAGVPLLLGHGTVLILRLSCRPILLEGDQRISSLLLGHSAVMDAVRAQLIRAGGSHLDVLIRGETGTGKDLAAREIHAASNRARGPWVSVNMAAIPVELAPAALFGSARGAFTGADKASEGYFQQAAGGTLFLDEIGDTDAAVQPQLLRALQEREVQRVGGAVEKVDLRVISATDAALDAQDSDFKGALRHRLGAIEIHLPALRHHPEDIGALLCHFLRSNAREAGQSDPLPTSGDDALLIAAWANTFFQFLRYWWPGNVRELGNVAGQLIWDSFGLPEVPVMLRDALSDVSPQEPYSRQTNRRRMQDIDEASFDEAMSSNDYEPGKVAQHLCVSRTSVYRRIEVSARYRLAGDISRAEIQQVLSQSGDNVAAAARQLGVSTAALRARINKPAAD